MMQYSEDFPATWDYYMVVGAGVFLCLAILNFLYYEYRVLIRKQLKDKYDFVVVKEIPSFVLSVKLAVVAICFYANSIMTDWVMIKGWVWFLGRIFLMTGVAVIFYVLLSNLIRIFYPRSLDKRLYKLRNKPRISKSGNKMRRLSEEEEDAYMTAEQIAEEGSSIHAVDFDVWLDDKTGERHVEKYFEYHRSEECHNCGYTTLRIINEEVTVAPTTEKEGTLVKHFKCTFCNHRERRLVHLQRLHETAGTVVS